VLPDKFVAGGIISKLSPSWRDFATSLKHTRQEFSIDALIVTLDVEEKARAMNARGRPGIGGSANFVQKNINARTNNKGKGKKHPHPQPQNLKAKQTIRFKKKKGKCYVCASEEHFAGKCPNCKDKDGKFANMVISEPTRTSGYGNYLPTVLSVMCSPEWWVDTDANIHVCVDISLFSSYQVVGTTSLQMGNGVHARVLGVGTVNLKFTSGKIR
jgi:hypothetical protein